MKSCNIAASATAAATSHCHQGVKRHCCIIISQLPLLLGGRGARIFQHFSLFNASLFFFFYFFHSQEGNTLVHSLPILSLFLSMPWGAFLIYLRYLFLGALCFRFWQRQTAAVVLFAFCDKNKCACINLPVCKLPPATAQRSTAQQSRSTVIAQHQHKHSKAQFFPRCNCTNSSEMQMFDNELFYPRPFPFGGMFALVLRL